MPINRLWQSKDWESRGFQDLEDRVIKRAVSILILGLIPGLILQRPFVFLGLIFGASISIFNFRFLAKDIERFSKFNNKKKASSFIRRHAILRHLIMAVALYIAMMIGGEEFFFSTALGLILIKISIFSFIILQGRRVIF